MMKKKLMAVAVGAALAAPALSYAAVEISGRANVGIGTWSATGATSGVANDYKSRMRVWDSGSNITIKAGEDLGGGLKAEFYLETGINVNSGDANGASGTPNSATGNWGSRQGWAGLSGNFGKVLFGKINTWYGSGDQDLTQAVYLDSSVQFATGVLTAGPSVNRQTSALRYNSPMLGPVEVLVTYAPQYQPAPGTTVMPNGDLTNGSVQAVTVQGAQGAVSGGFDYVVNQYGHASGVSGQKNTAWKLRGGFKYQPGAQISLILVNAKQDNVSALITERKQTAWEVNWEHQMGNIGLHAQYGVASKVNVNGSDLADSDTKAYELGIRFIMSKTVYTYINYVAYVNGNAANLDFNAGGMSSAGGGGIPATSAGADPKSLAFGVSYRF